MQEQNSQQSLTSKILKYTGFGVIVGGTVFGLKELSDAFIYNPATHILDQLSQLPEAATDTGQLIMDYVKDNIYKIQHYTNALIGLGIGAGSATGKAYSDWRHKRKSQQNIDEVVAEDN